MDRRLNHLSISADAEKIVCGARSIFTVVDQIQSLAHRYAFLNETHVGAQMCAPTS